ncbi:DUF3139 domain-containing protein [Paenibacillus sp. FSL H7-0737]|uniref:DUF3139 domain-containing protein n=1 Tax=Paenibacillus sp. FSL H7-0737 TaxID=1536775 RepID=UPI0004F66D29|nr:DUF3139 domain-containing protein [Paenibacillus sp. FSL H7-0737]AIQ24252.1 hypothetical protein H70737_16130 [Paenibacillus sp. FSL H7-0737]
MRNKLGIIGIVFLILIVLIGAGFYTSLQIKYNSLEKGLRNHLINIEGYSDSDIISIKAKLSSMPKYPVYVRFVDDPDTDYIFTDGGGDVPDWYQLDPKNPQRLKNK